MQNIFMRSKLAYIGHISKEAPIAKAGTFVDKKKIKRNSFFWEHEKFKLFQMPGECFKVGICKRRNKEKKKR